VRAAIEAGRREVYVVYLDAHNTSRDARHLKAFVKERDVRFKKRTREQLDQLANGTTHGGVMAACGPRKMQTLNELAATPDTGPIVLLDGIEDPFNFGYCTRALFAAGCRGLIVRQRNWAQAPEATGVIARSSAGAVDRLPIAAVEHPSDAVTWAKSQGLHVWAADPCEQAVPVDRADLKQPCLILVGGEKRGLPKATTQQADGFFEIPYVSELDAALSTVSAASVIGFEAARQRRQ